MRTNSHDARPPSSGDRLRVGVVGAGWWTRRVHLPELARHDAAQVVVVCDLDRERAAAAAGEYGARAVTDVSDVLAAEPAAVVVATPHDQHAAVAEACLSAGIDVLVEKPMTLDPREAWALVRAADESGARLHAGFTYIHGSPARHLRDLVGEGRLGELTLVSSVYATAVHRLFRAEVEWQRTEEAAAMPSLPDTYSAPSRGGGQLWAQAVHAIALVLWSTGLEPRSVAASFDGAGLDVDVSHALAVDFASGTVGSFAGTGHVHGHDRRVEDYGFFGSDGHALLDTRRSRLVLAPRVGEQSELSWPEADANPVEAPVRSLVDTALGRSTVISSGQLGAWTTGVAWAAQQAARTGERVTVPGPT